MVTLAGEKEADMELEPEAGDALRGLGEVAAARRAVVETVLVPNWYWWLVGALVVGIGAAADTRRPGVVVGVTVPAALLIAAATAWMIAGRGRAQLSKDLLGPSFVVGLLAFIWILVGASLGLAFGLRAAGVGMPGLAGTLLCSLGLVVGGPVFMHRLRRNMLVAPLR